MEEVSADPSTRGAKKLRHLLRVNNRCLCSAAPVHPEQVSPDEVGANASKDAHESLLATIFSRQAKEVFS
jgi:hypothetical protein